MDAYPLPDTVPFPDTPHGVIIAGLPNTGKKTLFNTLYGWQAVGPSPETIPSDDEASAPDGYITRRCGTRQ